MVNALSVITFRHMTNSANYYGNTTLQLVLQFPPPPQTVTTIQPRSFVVSVQGINDPPTVDIIGLNLVTITEDQSIAFNSLSFPYIALADVDATAQASIQLSLAVAYGTLRVNSAAATNGVAVNGYSSAASAAVLLSTWRNVTVTAPLSNLTALCDALTFTPPFHWWGDSSIAISINDLGNTGWLSASGGPSTPLIATLNRTLTVVKAVVLPTITLPYANYSLNSTAADIALPISISDYHLNGATDTIYVSSLLVTGPGGAAVGTVYVTTATGVESYPSPGQPITAGAAGARASLPMQGTLNNVNAALATLHFRPNTAYLVAGNATVTIVVSDGTTGENQSPKAVVLFYNPAGSTVVQPPISSSTADIYSSSASPLSSSGTAIYSSSATFQSSSADSSTGVHSSTGSAVASSSGVYSSSAADSGSASGSSTGSGSDSSTGITSSGSVSSSSGSGGGGGGGAISSSTADAAISSSAGSSTGDDSSTGYGVAQSSSSGSAPFVSSSASGVDGSSAAHGSSTADAVATSDSSSTADAAGATSDSSSSGDAGSGVSADSSSSGIADFNTTANATDSSSTGDFTQPISSSADAMSSTGAVGPFNFTRMLVALRLNVSTAISTGNGNAMQLHAFNSTFLEDVAFAVTAATNGSYGVYGIYWMMEIAFVSTAPTYVKSMIAAAAAPAFDVSVLPSGTSVTDVQFWIIAVAPLPIYQTILALLMNRDPNWFGGVWTRYTDPDSLVLCDSMTGLCGDQPLVEEPPGASGLSTATIIIVVVICFIILLFTVVLLYCCGAFAICGCAPSAASGGKAIKRRKRERERSDRERSRSKSKSKTGATPKRNREETDFAPPAPDDPTANLSIVPGGGSSVAARKPATDSTTTGGGDNRTPLLPPSGGGGTGNGGAAGLLTAPASSPPQPLPSPATSNPGDSKSDPAPPLVSAAAADADTKTDEKTIEPEPVSRPQPKAAAADSSSGGGGGGGGDGAPVDAASITIAISPVVPVPPTSSAAPEPASPERDDTKRDARAPAPPASSVAVAIPIAAKPSPPASPPPVDESPVLDETESTTKAGVALGIAAATAIIRSNPEASARFAASVAAAAGAAGAAAESRGKSSAPDVIVTIDDAGGARPRGAANSDAPRSDSVAAAPPSGSADGSAKPRVRSNGVSTDPVIPPAGSGAAEAGAPPSPKALSVALAGATAAAADEQKYGPAPTANTNSSKPSKGGVGFGPVDDTTADPLLVASSQATSHYIPPDEDAATPPHPPPRKPKSKHSKLSAGAEASTNPNRKSTIGTTVIPIRTDAAGDDNLQLTPTDDSDGSGGRNRSATTAIVSRKPSANAEPLRRGTRGKSNAGGAGGLLGATVSSGGGADDLEQFDINVSDDFFEQPNPTPATAAAKPARSKPPKPAAAGAAPDPATVAVTWTVVTPGAAAAAKKHSSADGDGTDSGESSFHEADELPSPAPPRLPQSVVPAVMATPKTNASAAAVGGGGVSLPPLNLPRAPSGGDAQPPRSPPPLSAAQLSTMPVLPPGVDNNPPLPSGAPTSDSFIPSPEQLAARRAFEIHRSEMERRGEPLSPLIAPVPVPSVPVSSIAPIPNEAVGGRGGAAGLASTGDDDLLDDDDSGGDDGGRGGDDIKNDDTSTAMGVSGGGGGGGSGAADAAEDDSFPVNVTASPAPPSKAGIAGGGGGGGSGSGSGSGSGGAQPTPPIGGRSALSPITEDAMRRRKQQRKRRQKERERALQWGAPTTTGPRTLIREDELSFEERRAVAAASRVTRHSGSGGGGSRS